MAKIRKAVFRSGIVMLSLLAAIVLSGSVAYAQECLARANGATMARATGITEAVGGVELLCRARPPAEFGFGVEIPEEVTISIELNTPVTNQEGDNDNVGGLTYMGVNGAGSPSLGDDTDYMADMDNDNEREVLSSDGMTISWKLNTGEDTSAADYIQIVAAASTVTIGGILANAAALGADADVTAVVRVNGEAVHEGTLKLADVEIGLEVPEDKFEVASGLQCLKSSETATILFKEGFNSAFKEGGAIVLNLRGVPDGVTVTASMMGTGEPLDPPYMAAMGDVEEVPPAGDLAPVTLMTGDMSGVEVEDGVATVTISSTGMGQVVYEFVDEDDTTDTILEGTDPADGEWNTVELTFSWDAAAPPLGMGSVTVSFHPVSSDDDDEIRFVAGPTRTVFEVSDCVSSLLFPFVTNMYGFETGIAITNTSSEAGSCMLSFVGTEAPADDMEVMVMGESVNTFGVSTMAPGFQGYIDATCEFREGKGFAFITNGFGSMGGPTAAQGYIVAEEIAESD